MLSYEVLIAKIYFTKIPSFVQTLDSLSHSAGYWIWKLTFPTVKLNATCRIFTTGGDSGESRHWHKICSFPTHQEKSSYQCAPSPFVAPIPFFFNFMLFYTQIMLILIVIHVQYLQNVAFFFETASNGQSHFSADSHNSMKKSLHKNFSSLHWEENFPTYPLYAIWKTLVCFTFLS